MHNSLIPLGNVPDQHPLNYRYHHHLGVNLSNHDIWLEEAADHEQWQGRSHHVQFGLNQCLELAVPWSDLHVQPDWPLELIVVLSKQGEFVEHLPENMLVPLQVP
jgi:hypothetical protein